MSPFDLYEATSRGNWRRINEAPIPSESVLPIEVVQYNYFARGIRGASFHIVDTDALGHETWHGPFELGQAYGVKDDERSLIEHEAIMQEHEAKSACPTARPTKPATAASITAQSWR